MITEADSAYKVTTINKYSTVDIQLKKVDENNQSLNGSTFTLTKSDTVIGSYSPGGTATETDPTTGDEVSVTLGNPIDLGGLGVGIYKLEETGVPTYYQKAEDVYFEVYKESGTLKARLVDASGTPLAVQSAMTSTNGTDGPVYTITVTNQRELYSVNVQKKVTGNMGDVNKDFTFTASYTLNGTTTNLPDFTLKHNQTTTLPNIPAGATITITETSPASDGYDTSNDHGEGLIATFEVTEDGMTVIFTNDKVVNPDTGVRTPSIPFVLMMLISFTGLFALFFERRRVYER